MKKEEKKSFISAGAVIVTGVSFGIGVLEALVYYNLGQATGGKKFTYKFPPAKEFIQTAALVLLTSAITGYIVGVVENQFGNNEQLSA